MRSFSWRKQLMIGVMLILAGILLEFFSVIEGAREFSKGKPALWALGAILLGTMCFILGILDLFLPWFGKIITALR